MARHIRVNTDLKPIREIDIENASKDELIEYLYQTIHNEVEKGEDADCDLIRECSDWLGELTADKVVFTPEELEVKLEALKNGKNIHLSHPYKTHSYQPFIKRKIFARVSILVASLVLLSFISLSALAMHVGFDSVWIYISTNFRTILGMEAGEQIADNGITIIKNSEQKRYNTIEELISEEGLNILYPHNIPNDQIITQIRCVSDVEDRYVLYCVFSDNSYKMQISNYYMTNMEMLDEFVSITINDINYYVFSKNEDSFYAICQYNGYEYGISSSNYEDLIIIINNMKG